MKLLLIALLLFPVYVFSLGNCDVCISVTSPKSSLSIKCNEIKSIKMEPSGYNHNKLTVETTKGHELSQFSDENFREHVDFDIFGTKILDVWLLSKLDSDFSLYVQEDDISNPNGLKKLEICTKNKSLFERYNEYPIFNRILFALLFPF